MWPDIDCFLRNVDRERTMSQNTWVSGPLCHLRWVTFGKFLSTSEPWVCHPLMEVTITTSKSRCDKS